MRVVVVTGGIGSGKSYVCRYLSARYGWPVYEADARVKELYQEHPTLLNDIEQALGVSVRNPDGSLASKLLADVIFKDPQALACVEGLVFPVLSEDFRQWKQGYEDCPFVLLESATILEKPQLEDMGDVVVLIDAPVHVRAARASVRDGVSDDAVRQRMGSQQLMNDISSGVVRCPADFCILNDKTPAELDKKLDILVENIGKQKCY